MLLVLRPRLELGVELALGVELGRVLRRLLRGRAAR